jgi:hypothetical protein
MIILNWNFISLLFFLTFKSIFLLKLVQISLCYKVQNILYTLDMSFFLFYYVYLFFIYLLLAFLKSDHCKFSFDYFFDVANHLWSYMALLLNFKFSFYFSFQEKALLNLNLHFIIIIIQCFPYIFMFLNSFALLFTLVFKVPIEYFINDYSHLSFKIYF